MFTTQVYRVIVSSLSGTMEEIYVVKDVIRKWNQENAEREGKLFMPVEAQDVDVLIGVVGNRVEKTDSVLRMVETGKKVMLFFNAYQDPNNTIPSEREEMIAFKERMQGRCYCGEYNGGEELGTSLNIMLESFKEQ